MSTPAPYYVSTISGMDVESQSKFYIIPSKLPWWRRLLRRFGR